MRRAKVSALSLLRMKRMKEKICMVTCYDYPSASHVECAGVDVALCGDSLGMVELGYATTQPVTLEEMLHHCRAVRRGLSDEGPMLVCDLPFGSYEESPEVALRAAYRVMKEGGADAVKVEGGRSIAPSVSKLVKSGVAVLGHVGLLPQSISTLGGFRAQGRTAVKARSILDDALALQDAGAFGVVAECVPPPLGRALSESLEIPVIGIGAGPFVDGQVLVYHDLLGALSHPHHRRFVPKFCKVFADLGDKAVEGLEAYKQDVKQGTFPDDDYSPYEMPEEEAAKFQAMLDIDREVRAAKSKQVKQRLKDQDEYETIHLY
ncbi:hypothetical protein CTAYLR_001723 [Chrysophaeum taylorii]|uniref:3-methyl-2-oxobutanoate hydroxymethyltransferase n=1 Tax=Chrysophaeum taylorii TaxID=2483200 RepID=A0AAD7XGN2_9STRA|nr:hypothetical protein CTAYLR_001723 [Chrysophaeum taylorii]